MKDAGSDTAPGMDGGAVCAPGPKPGNNMMYSRTGWRAQWNVVCNFTQYGGCPGVLPPEKAFDGRGDTRASIGNTHLEHGSPTAEVIGDTFVFDMQTCNQLGKIHMFAAAPPNNQGSFDARDFPGAVEVRVSGDCITSAQGTITGTFGPVVATGMEPQPGCQDNGTPCNMPFVINFPQPTAAKCVSIRLTKILKIGGGVWWAIDELQAYP